MKPFSRQSHHTNEQSSSKVYFGCDSVCSAWCQRPEKHISFERKACFLSQEVNFIPVPLLRPSSSENLNQLGKCELRSEFRKLMLKSLFLLLFMQPCSQSKNTFILCVEARTVCMRNSLEFKTQETDLKRADPTNTAKMTNAPHKKCD